MKFDISALFDDSKPSEIVDTENVSGEGSLLAENTNVCFGTFNEGDSSVHVRFYLSKPFVSDNYNGVGFSPYPVEDDDDNYVYVGNSPENLGSPEFLMSETDFDNAEEAGFEFSLKKDGYIVYPMAEAANGRSYIVGDGKSRIIWFSKAFFEVTNVTSDSVTVEFWELEQYLSKENYGALAFTTQWCGADERGYDSLSAKTQEKRIDFNSNSRTGNMILKGIPSNATIQLYFYKKTPKGRYYFLGNIEVTTKAFTVPECNLDVSYRKIILGNGVECLNYPIISYADWNSFCNDINSVRLQAGLTSFSFTNVEEDDEMHVDLFNDAISAIIAIYNHLDIDIPEGLTAVYGYEEITPVFFSVLVSALVDIRDTMEW